MKRRCSRCGFPSDEKIPVGEDGLCLWCRLAEQGVDWADFYKSGAWMEIIEWRGEPSPGDQVRELIRQRKRQAGHTWADVEELVGSRARHSIERFVGRRQDTWLPPSTVDAIARYLGRSVDGISAILGEMVFEEESSINSLSGGTHIRLDWPEARRLTQQLWQRKTRAGDTFTDLRREYGINHGVWYRFVEEYEGQQVYLWARTLRRFADYLDLSFEQAVALVQA